LTGWQRRIVLQRGAALIVSDAWELTSTPSELWFSLITPCAVTVSGDLLRFASRDLPSDRHSGSACIQFDAAAFDVDVETAPVEDQQLNRVWGVTLYRVRLRLRTPETHGSCTLTVTSGTR